MSEATTAILIGVGLIVTGFAVRYIAKALVDAIVEDIGDALEARWGEVVDRTVRDALSPIYKEMKLNGGESIKDRVKSIDDRLRRVEQTLEDEITFRPERRD